MLLKGAIKILVSFFSLSLFVIYLVQAQLDSEPTYSYETVRTIRFSASQYSSIVIWFLHGVFCAVLLSWIGTCTPMQASGFKLHCGMIHLLQELSMLYPLQSVFCLPCIYYREKKRLTDLYRGPKMQKPEDMIRQVHGVRHSGLRRGFWWAWSGRSLLRWERASIPNSPWEILSLETVKFLFPRGYKRVKRDRKHFLSLFSTGTR